MAIASEQSRKMLQLTPAGLRLTFSSVLSLFAISACSAPTLGQFVGEANPAYLTGCRKMAADHQAAIKELTYLRPDLKTVIWPFPAKPDSDGLVSEETVFEAIRDGKLKFVHVQARGGIGKTELGKALIADNCATVPSYRVDLRDAVANKALDRDANPIISLIAGQMSLPADNHETLQELLAAHRFVLVLDSLDEVAVSERPRIFAAMDEGHKRYPLAQVVLLARPSIFDRYYGLPGFDAVLELPPLDCGRARSSVVRLAEDDAERKQIQGFLTTWNLDRQSVIGQQCYYPYLATYRDIQVVQRLAKNFKPDEELGGLQHNLTEVHEAILAERLLKELEELHYNAQQVLGAVDSLVAKGGFVDGEWNLTFTLQRCFDSRGGDNAESRQICEKLFQSVLFERIGGTDDPQSKMPSQWKFGHQAIADLFVARWIDAELAKTPGNCAVVDQHAADLVGKEVGGYLVGRGAGAKCLAPVAHALCKANGFDKFKVAMLYKGLPLGPQRAEFVKAAKDWEAAHGADACVTKMLAGL